MNVHNRVSDDRRNDALINRESELNPPEFNPGMGDNMSNDFFNNNNSDPFGGSGSDPFGGGGSDPFSSGNSNPFGGSGGSDPFGSSGDSNPFGSAGSDPFGGGGVSSDPFGNSGFNTGSDPFGGGTNNFGSDPFGGGFGGTNQLQPQQQQQPTKSMEDAVFDGLASGAKATANVFKAAGQAFKTFDASRRCNMGKQLLLTSGISVVVGIILMILKFSVGFSFLFGGLVTMAVGVLIFMIAYDTLKKNGGTPQIQQQTQPPAIENDFGSNNSDFGDSDFGNSDFGDSDFGDSDFEDSDFDDSSMDTDESDFDTDDSDFDDDFNFDEDVSSGYETGPALTKEEVLNTLVATNGAVTRQYILERVIQVLESITPDYAYSRTLDESSDSFADWAAIVEDCATVLKTNDKVKLPQLLEVKEQLLHYTLTISRATWCKTENLVKEIVNYVGYDETSNKMDEGVFGSGHDVANKVFITITKGDTARITVKDAIVNNKDFFTNSDNYMPVCLGIDSSGNTILVDMKYIDALMMTGMPRSGKSWAMKSIIAQMMMFNSPRDLQFYFLDPKASISDFCSIKTPHVRKFVTTDDAIVAELEYVVHDLAPKRKEIIGSVPGCKNIWDYRAARPTEDMPLIYVVIDEVMTLSERMDKDTKNKFQALLAELVTQLPAAGIRIFLVPHMVRDTIIKKTTSALIPCRISVGGDAEHIADTLGDTKFPYKLSHVGDMAVKLRKGDTQFVHSCIVASDNARTDDFFDFLNAMWLKIDPSLEEMTDLTNSAPLQVNTPIENIEFDSTPVYQQPVRRTITRGKKKTSTAQQETPTFASPNFDYENSGSSSDDDINIWGE